ncbi:MAG TPA: bifunctional diaminohydroxyphosphoribosylaminopyrimidine deaminase/5-amino-6-(5-phosphoribosylamino)uracil reductase RibD [Actinomycetota bacterium]
MANARRGSDSAQHVAFMRRALELARNGLGLASPNPMVGAVLVADGRVVGEGWHEGPGTAHAEVMALEAAGDRARGATLYATLEPCSHQGRTPPCATRVVEAGVARVVAALQDPNPLVDGSGFGLLRKAGVEVVVGVLQDEGRELIAGFAKHIGTGLPFVVLKMAASLDGKIAARDGSSRWITGEEARRDAHRLRAGSDAVVVGVGTALADDPSLTVRLDRYRGRQPLRVVVDGRGRLPASATVLNGTALALVATTPSAPPGARAAWEGRGADVLVLDPDEEGRVPLGGLMAALGKRDVQTVLIEGGATLGWSAVESGVVDRLVLYLAPKLLGGTSAPGVLGGDGVATITDALPLGIRSVEPIGEDLKVVADVHRDR